MRKLIATFLLFICSFNVFCQTENSTDVSYVIQVGAFASEDSVKRWVNKFKEEKIPNYVLNKTTDGTIFFILRAGPFTNLNDAESTFSKISSLGLSPRIVSTTNTIIQKNITDEQNKLEVEKKRVEEENQKIKIYLSKLKLDDVSNVLNYSSGLGDEGSEYSSWYPSNIKCQYIKIDKKTGKTLNSINLNDLDPKSIKVVTMNRTNTISNTIYKYQTQEVQYMGRSIFMGENLDQDRIQRGWNLIYSKYCSGTKKAF